MSEMEIDEASPERPHSHSYSYNSSTIQRGDSAAVTQSAESYQNSAGQHVSKHVQSMGDKMVQETTKNGKTTRTLTNLSEAEVEDFSRGIKSSKLLGFHNNNLLQKQQPELPAALEADLAKMQQAQQ